MKGIFKFYHKNGTSRLFRYYGAALNAFFKEYGYSMPYEVLDRLTTEKIVKIG